MTNFQNQVYQAVEIIPVGKVTTYKIIAEFLGTRAYRAVGTALKNNPYAPTIACHRVIASDLSIGGFAGTKVGAEIERKLKLLADEGVKFRNGKLANTALVFYYA